MSTLKVTNLQKLDGTTFPIGKIGQVLTVTIGSEQSTTSSSYSDVSGLSLAITPSATSSKIMVQTLIHADGRNGSGTSSNNRIKLFRDSTFLPSYSGSTDTFAQYIQESGDGWTYGFHQLNFLFIDAHGQSGGSNLTYKVQGTTYSSSTTMYLNRRNYESAQRGQSRITLTEIAA